MNKLRSFLAHLLHYGETYILLPLLTLAIFGAIAYYHYVNGRDNVDDPSAALVATVIAFLPGLMLVALAGYIQTRIIGFRGKSITARSDGNPGSIWDDVFDLVAWVVIVFTLAIVCGIHI